MSLGALECHVQMHSSTLKKRGKRKAAELQCSPPLLPDLPRCAQAAPPAPSATPQSRPSPNPPPGPPPPRVAVCCVFGLSSERSVWKAPGSSSCAHGYWNAAGEKTSHQKAASSSFKASIRTKTALADACHSRHWLGRF